MDTMVKDRTEKALAAHGAGATAPKHVMLSVVIPAYNEERGIQGAVERVRTALAAQPFDWDVIVVNDGSTDGTLAAAQASGMNRQAFQKLMHRFGLTADKFRIPPEK